MLPVSTSSTDFSSHLKNILSGTCLKSSGLHLGELTPTRRTAVPGEAYLHRHFYVSPGRILIVIPKISSLMLGST